MRKTPGTLCHHVNPIIHLKVIQIWKERGNLLVKQRTSEYVNKDSGLALGPWDFIEILQKGTRIVDSVPADGFI